MLEELTNDIHQSPNKQKVLMELANCIASGEDIILSLYPLTPGFRLLYVYYMYLSLITEGN